MNTGETAQGEAESENAHSEMSKRHVQYHSDTDAPPEEPNAAPETPVRDVIRECRTMLTAQRSDEDILREVKRMIRARGDEADQTARSQQRETGHTGATASIGGWFPSAEEGSQADRKSQDDTRSTAMPKRRWGNVPPDVISTMGIEELFGKDVTLGVPGTQQTSSTTSRIAFFREKGQQLMSAADGWERVTLIVDSGASDTVVPPNVCRRATLHHTPKVGTEY